ncbi:hypothetical protein RJ640_029050, partial [Escallonia rubra]
RCSRNVCDRVNSSTNEWIGSTWKMERFVQVIRFVTTLWKIVSRFLGSIMIIQVSIFSNERFEDLLILTTDCRVDHSDLSIHRCRSRTYEWGYSPNSQRKKEVS